MLKSSFGFEFSIALRYLRAKRKQGFISLVGFLSVAGVCLGVMALVVVIAVMSGAEKDLRKRILGMEPHLILNSKTGSFADYKKVCEKLNNKKNVSDALPNLSGRVMLRSKWGFTGTIIRGVDSESRRKLIKGFEPLKATELLENTSSGKNSIIIGKGIAESLGVAKGDSVFALTSDWKISPVGVMPKMTELEVAAVYESGLYEYDSAVAYMNLENLQSLLGMGKKVNGIGVYITDVYAADDLAKTIDEVFPGRFFTRTWMEVNHSLFSALKLEKTAMFIILTLIILVAAFNIASSLIMLVMEKTKEIAIMKTMGATKKSIKRIFVIQGTFVGSIGTLSGVFLGIIMCEILSRYKFIKLPDAYPFTTLPVDLAFSDVALIAFSALLICFFATVYPASKAANLDPVEGIRYGE
ncbi:MAG: lipoprotein-releasing ABC transporter permease subunit [Desulforegulaceae bacterium]|nr:lipoprotein-releasing ABC transporter permease subunit [Desulforegulaceae bacterium]